MCRWFWWRFSGFFPHPACVRFLCCVILARTADVRLMFMNHSQVFFDRSLHLVLPRKLNSSLRLISDFGEGVLHLLLRFLNCGWRKPPVGHFAHIQCKSDVGLFYLYLTSFLHHSISATTRVAVRNTWVFRTALTALTEPRTLRRRITRYPSPFKRTLFLWCDVYAPSEGHVCYTLRRSCSYAQAVYTTPGNVKS